MEKTKKQEIIKNNQLNTKDTGSSVVQIALLTEQIKELSEHLKNHRKDNSCRLGLIKKVNQRKRHLKFLAKIDLNSYNSIIEKLNIRK